MSLESNEFSPSCPNRKVKYYSTLFLYKGSRWGSIQINSIYSSSLIGIILNNLHMLLALKGIMLYYGLITLLFDTAEKYSFTQVANASTD